MKLSTSSFARGRVGLLAALLLMALLVAANIDPNVVCLVGVATWIAVTLLLSAFKDKELAPNAPNPPPVRQPPSSPISLHTAAAPPPPGLTLPPSEARPTKKCPYCAEAILSEAIVCRYCGRDLPMQSPQAPRTRAGDTQPQLRRAASRKGVQPLPHTSTFAVLSLVTGIATWTVLPIIGALIAVISGRMAKNEIRASKGRLTGGGLATAGLVLGSLQLLLVLTTSCVVIVSLLAPEIGNVSGPALPTTRPTATPPTPRVVTGPAMASVPTTRPINPLRADGCLKWSEVTVRDVGNSEICVFGVVQKAVRGDGLYTIYFSDIFSDLKLEDYNYFYTDISPGECISITGKIRDNVSYLVVVPEHIYGQPLAYCK